MKWDKAGALKRPEQEEPPATVGQAAVRLAMASHGEWVAKRSVHDLLLGAIGIAPVTSGMGREKSSG